MGDFAAIEASHMLSKADNYIFWVCWLLTVTITCIVFLNFIVAEASASYAKVVETLIPVMWREKASMIAESEDMTMNRFKNNTKFPKYIIVR
jgi:hypothetical protein